MTRLLARASSAIEFRSLVLAAALAGAAMVGACSSSSSSSSTPAKPAAATADVRPAQPHQQPPQQLAAVQAVQQAAPARPTVRAASAVEAGKYLVVVSGCNDCHTPGFAQSGGNVPESQWLVGSPVGFRGPWGTTYPANLRRSLQHMTADDFVTIARHRKDKPPMPWSQLHGMSDADLRAIHAYVRSLPVAGPATAEYVPPTKEPQTPYYDFVPKNLPAAAASALAQ